MNSEKILIEINVAGVNRSFDCIVPRTLSAKLLCRGFLELVEESMGIPFGAYRQALLMSERTAAFFRRSRRSTTPISTAATRFIWSEARFSGGNLPFIAPSVPFVVISSQTRFAVLDYNHSKGTDKKQK